MKFLMLSLLVISLIACSKKEDGDKKPAPKGQPGNDITNTSTCKGPAPLNANIRSSVWFKVRRFGKVQITEQYGFGQNELFMRVICQSGQDQHMVDLSAPLILNSKFFSITQEREAGEKVILDGEEFYCGGVLPEMKMVNYSFVGTCLKTEDGNGISLYPSSL